MNYDINELIENYGEDYLNETAGSWEDYVHTMDDLEYYLESEGLEWILCRMYYGGVWTNNGFDSSQTFNPLDDYYVVNAYGNFFSMNEYAKAPWIREKIEEWGTDDFIQWCSEQGYIEE